MPLPTIMEYSDKMPFLEAGTTSDSNVDIHYDGACREDIEADYAELHLSRKSIQRPWKVAAYSSIALNVLLILALVGFYYHTPSFPFPHPPSPSSPASTGLTSSTPPVGQSPR
ncbi:hypothetical protein K431DRAFT_291946 [Polychaeton citri CBS 116435]|uniref:Uncharacterized protein n=1 Tax=Polychaeton citri CBS 116435 TaxID=1314669 RepID=A0A9P4QBB3_9PEZI|nr:hypothetical protein K431DRAFT_291946 [Polychaeton citri CBS 116435]